MAHPPFKCYKALFFNREEEEEEESRENKELIQSFREYDYIEYNIKNDANGFKMYNDVEKYIKSTVSSFSSTSFCFNETIAGMSTTYLLKRMADKNIFTLVCYDVVKVSGKNKIIPFSTLLFKYLVAEKRFYIVSVCADKTRAASKGSGSLLIDDLVNVAVISNVNSIYLHSVQSAFDTYKKKGFVKTGKMVDSMPEMELDLIGDVMSSSASSRRSSRSSSASSRRSSRSSSASSSKSSLSDYDTDDMSSGVSQMSSSASSPEESPEEANQGIEIWNRRDGLRPLTGLNIEQKLQKRFPDFLVGKITKGVMKRRRTANAVANANANANAKGKTARKTKMGRKRTTRALLTKKKRGQTYRK